MTDHTKKINVTYLNAGVGVSKVPLAISGNGAIEATEHGLVLTGVKPGINRSLLIGLGVAVVGIATTYMTGKTWMAVTGIFAAAGTGMLPKKPGTTKITREYPWTKIRNVRLGDPESRVLVAQGAEASSRDVIWLEVKEGINWKSIKVTSNVVAAQEIVQALRARIA